MLRVEGLSKHFGGFTAVDNVDFNLEKGEILGLIGPNGSGKSTIFNMLSGVLKPNEGSILLEGEEIAGASSPSICLMGVGRTFQIPRPIRRLTILENAALAGYYGQAGAVSREDAWRSAAESLELVGLPTDANASVDTLGAAGLKKLELAKALDRKGILVSASSACHATRLLPSHVLKAIGLTDEEADEALRVSLGRFTTAEDVACLLSALREITAAGADSEEEEVEAAGGHAIRDRVGHSFIKATMREKGAVFGGELSGHFYFADNYTTDSGVLAMISVINLLARNPDTPLSPPRSLCSGVLR